MRKWMLAALAVCWSSAGGAAEVAPASPTAAAAARGAEAYESAIAAAATWERQLCGVREGESVDACLRARHEARSRLRAEKANSQR